MNDKKIIKEDDKINYEKLYFANMANISNENIDENHKHENYITIESNSGNTSDGISSIHEFLSDLNKSEINIEIDSNNDNNEINLNSNNAIEILNSPKKSEISRGFNTTKTEIYSNKKINKIKDQGKNTENDISSIISINCYSSLQDCEDQKDYSNNENLAVVLKDSNEIMYAQTIENVMLKNFNEILEKNLTDPNLIISTPNNDNNNDKNINSTKNLLQIKEIFIDNLTDNLEKNSKSENINKKDDFNKSNDEKSSQIFSEILEVNSCLACTTKSDINNLSSKKTNSMSNSNSNNEKINNNENCKIKQNLLSYENIEIKKKNLCLSNDNLKNEVWFI